MPPTSTGATAMAARRSRAWMCSSTRCRGRDDPEPTRDEENDMDDMTQPTRLRRFRDLPLFAKLLVPFLVLILAVGAGGLYLVVHDMSSRARAALNEELLRRSLDA